MLLKEKLAHLFLLKIKKYKFNRRLNSVNSKVAIATLVYGTKVKHYAGKVSVNN